MVVARRFLSIPTGSVTGPTEVVLELPQSTIGEIGLELTLLVENLTTTLRVQPSSGAPIVLRLLADDRMATALVEPGQDGSITFAIGRNQAEYLQMVLLRAYRDGMAEVTHVHIPGEQDGRELDLTLMFDTSAEPMSAEEAEQLLKD